ncbi:CBM_collapsed_G0024440.mRNA.1.CDS.1 [Saccharomyces cerevisiae]|nr:CBM_collapsed_G0024440.mRNA.1.CDS.1 [Saccharomyces cerevisiae]
MGINLSPVYVVQEDRTCLIANVERREAILAALENALDSSDEESAAEGEDADEKEPLEQDEDRQMFPDINWKKIDAKYKCIPFDWSSLNILAELFLKLAVSEVDGIKTIKMCTGGIQRRESPDILGSCSR